MSSRSRSGRLIGDGKYELLSQIGSGAMGTVWLARHVALDRIVAVKVLGIVTRANSEGRQRFLTEARSASLLRHANSVRILDYAAEGDDCWLVMEFLEGRNLAELLTEQSPLTPRRAIAITSQILAAVAEAHDFGLVHRDLKPANIMLMPWVDDDGHETEHVKVLDFGIATIAAHGNQSGEVAGTPEYMSPEQAQGLSVDPRSDVYAVGIVLHQIVTGELPFHGDTALETMLAHVNATPRPPRAVNPALSERLAGVILRAISKAPGNRFPDARAMRTALLDLPEAAGLRSDSRPKIRPVTAPALSVAAVMPASVSAPEATAPKAAAKQLEPAPDWRRLIMFAVVLALLAAGSALVLTLTRNDPTPAANELARGLQPIAVPSSARLAPDVIAASDAVPSDIATVAEVDPDTAVDTTIDTTIDTGPPIEIAQVAVVDTTIAPETIAVATAEAKVDATTKPDPKREPQTPKVVVVERPDPSQRVTPPADPVTKPEVVKVAERVAPIETPPPEVVAHIEPHVVPPTPTGPKPDAAKPALAANVAVRDLVVKGSLPRSAVQRALDTTRPALEQCYRVAAQGAQHDSAGKVDASIVIDVDGQATQVSVSSFALSGFANCARQALARARSRERPDTGTAQASFSLAITPNAPGSP